LERAQNDVVDFSLAIGKFPVGWKSARGIGIVVGALCSPANQFTEYWIRKSNGKRFWSTMKQLNPA
jgi:hypothetical protein